MVSGILFNQVLEIAREKKIDSKMAWQRVCDSTECERAKGLRFWWMET